MLLTREIEFEKGAEILAHFVGFPACQQHKSTGSDLVLFLVNNSDLYYIIWLVFRYKYVSLVFDEIKSKMILLRLS